MIHMSVQTAMWRSVYDLKVMLSDKIKSLMPLFHQRIKNGRENEILILVWDQTQSVLRKHWEASDVVRQVTIVPRL